jgi:hypothetical protein
VPAAAESPRGGTIGRPFVSVGRAAT